MVPTFVPPEWICWLRLSHPLPPPNARAETTLPSRPFPPSPPSPQGVVFHISTPQLRSARDVAYPTFGKRRPVWQRLPRKPSARPVRTSSRLPAHAWSCKCSALCSAHAGARGSWQPAEEAHAHVRLYHRLAWAQRQAGTYIFRPRRVAAKRSREWRPFGRLERSPRPAYFSPARRYNLSHRAAYVDRGSV